MIRAVDLYAGAGGASEGLLEAATARGEVVNLTAVNHWPTAVATHTENHPTAQHYCMRIDALDPRVAVPGRKLDLLIAAPECTHHSTARGGKPINDQSRAGAWQILHWLDHIRVEHVLIENVPEFRTWGPLNAKDRPIKSKKGDTFRAFINALEQKGYNVEYRVLNAADYGAATTRRRLFIQARRGKKPINWPEATHSKTGSPTLFGGTKKWRAAREIIDWSITGESIFRRKKPLAAATMRRILEGLRRFGGPQLEPFLVVLRNHMDGQSIDVPVPTIAAEGQHLALAQPFIVPFRSEDGHARPRVKDIDDPLQTVTTENPIGLAEPFIFQSTHGGRARAIDGPMPTVTGAHRGELGIVEPMILPQGGGGVARPIDQPVSTVHGDGMGLIEPFIITPGGADLRGGRSAGDPLATITGSDRFAVVSPFVLGQQSNSAPRDVNESPLPTIAGAGKISKVDAFIVQAAHGEGDKRRVKSLDEPLGTLPCSNSFALSEPVLVNLKGQSTATSMDVPTPTITAHAGHLAVAEPFIVGMEHGGRTLDIDAPVPTITTAKGGAFGVAEPYLTEYYGNGVARPVTEPVPTLTTKDRLALVQPVVNGYTLDIRFRMLKPHELAAAMSFPRGYTFTGNKGEQVKQIGNAWDVSMGRALCGAILDGRAGAKSTKVERIA